MFASAKGVPEVVVVITRSTSLGPGFMEGEVVQIIGAKAVPQELEPVSRPHVGPPPGTARVISLERLQRDIAHEHASQRTPERPRDLTARDIRARFGWSQEDLDVAREFGFPAAYAARELGSYLARRQEHVWRADQVEVWATRAKHLLASMA